MLSRTTKQQQHYAADGYTLSHTDKSQKAAYSQYRRSAYLAERCRANNAGRQLVQAESFLADCASVRKEPQDRVNGSLPRPRGGTNQCGPSPRWAEGVGCEQAPRRERGGARTIVWKVHGWLFQDWAMAALARVALLPRLARSLATLPAAGQRVVELDAKVCVLLGISTCFLSRC